MSSINAKLGLKPASRARQATHGSGLVSAARCPFCDCRHVVEHLMVAPGERERKPWRMCGANGNHQWQPGQEPGQP